MDDLPRIVVELPALAALWSQGFAAGASVILTAVGVRMLLGLLRG